MLHYTPVRNYIFDYLGANSKLSLKSGTVIAVPIPVEDEIKDVLKLNKVIAEALSQAK